MTSAEGLSGAPSRGTAAGATGSPGVVGEPWAGRPNDPRGVVRPARPEDVQEILAMVRELAEYERSAHEVLATEDQLAQLLFGTNTPSGAPAAYCHVVALPVADADADAGTDDPTLAGMALWFLNASTWMGQHGIYLEDLYVRPAFRGQGLGQALMAELARICVDRRYARLEWWVLDWNSPAIDFYRRMGARAMDEWTVHRISGTALHDLALRAPAR